MKKLCLTLLASSIFAYSFALTSITTKKVLGGPFCGGAQITVSYTVDAPANPGNIFIAQLSNKNGGWNSPLIIGQVTATGSGNISATIPLGTATGLKYRIRVVYSTPSVPGSH